MKIHNATVKTPANEDAPGHLREPTDGCEAGFAATWRRLSPRMA